MRNGPSGLLVPLVALAVLASFALPADAATVGSFVKVGANFASDNNAEYLAVDLDSDGNLDVGDIIRGAIDINTFNQTDANIGGSTGNYQWAGVFALRVRAIENFNAATGRGDIVFEPDPGFAAWVATLDTDLVTGGTQAPNGPAIATGTMARLWTNSTATSDFTSDLGGRDNNVATAATGDFFWDLGFADPDAASHVDGGAIVSDNGEGWVALNGGVALTALQTAAGTTTLGTGNFGLSILQAGAAADFTSLLILQQWDVISAGLIGATVGDEVMIIGSSTVRGALNAEDNAGFHAGSDTNFGFLAIPLPAAALPGLGMLLGLGLLRLRRRKDDNE